MNKFRPLILAVATVISGLLAYGIFTLPSPKPYEYEGFSALRVVEDIEAISRAPHSVAQPEERARVRQYLIDCLYASQADTVKVFTFDSLVGPKNRHVEYTFDCHNILAEFAPLKASQDTTYLMLMAHYDSRYEQPMPKDTVWSYGAADNGYGLGVTLETILHLVKVRDTWSQGVKILFTDAEEVGMMGAKAMVENNPEVFENVGLIINLEARGPWGPVLLFETSPGNEKAVDLYASAARYPYTYSLTTVVYSFMPMFTDFTQVKDQIPGFNFSTIADVNHYHTDLDNFGNISPKSIQHYGEQVLPIVMKYVTSDEYASVDALKATEDAVNFTIPVLGLFNFSKTGYLIFNVAVFILFLMLFGIEGLRGRIGAVNTFNRSCMVLGLAVLVLLLGEGAAFVCAKIAGARFSLFGTVQGVPFDNAAMIALTSVLFVVSVFAYMARRKKAVMKTSGSMRASAASHAATRHAHTLLYATLALMCLLSTVLVFTVGENMMFFIPLVCGTGAMILYRLTSLRVWLLAAMVIILLHAFSFYYALAMALTIGAYGAVAMLAFIDMMLLIPMADLYMMPVPKKNQ